MGGESLRMGTATSWRGGVGFQIAISIAGMDSETK